MLITALLWFLLSFSFWGIGKLLANNFGPASMREDYPETSYFFLGISVAGLLSGIWWLFLPVNHLFIAVVNGTGVGYGLACLPAFPDLNFRRPVFLFAAALFFLAMLMKSVGPTGFYDCGLYYVQTMRWVQQFPVVPGLANLHIRFGSPSLWHILSAAYDLPFLWKGNFDSLGELMLFWFLCFHGWQFYSLKGFERFLSLGLLLASIFFSAVLAGSPSPDLACGILGMHTLWQFRKFLRFWEPRERNDLNTRGLALFIQSLFLVGIKLSCLPFLLISLVVCFLLLREKRWVQIFKLTILGFLAIAGMGLRSYFLTGWFLFPVLKGPFQPDWQLSDATIQEYQGLVKGFARYILSPEQFRAGLNYGVVAGQTLWDWLPFWASQRTTSECIFISGAVAGWLFLFWYAGNKVRKQFSAQWPLVFFTWLSGMMLLFWFLNAPDPRFGIAVLGSCFSYLVASLLIRLEYFLKPITDTLMKVVIAVFSVIILYVNRDSQSIHHHLWTPATYMKPRLNSFRLSEKIAVFAPSDEQNSPWLDNSMCWDAPLPCAVRENPLLRLRGKELKDGFYLVSAEKE